jgi:hypothetical protein
MAVQCSDAGLQAAMASIKTDQAPDGLRNNFEAAASHLLPSNPVQKKRTDRPRNKRDHADISDTTGGEVEVAAFGANKGIGKTGIHLRYHNSDNYKKLSNDQKDKLHEWRTTGQGKGKSDKPDTRKKPRYDTEKAIALAVREDEGCQTSKD